MITATYSPEDNKLRLYPSARLDAETYARVKAAGYKWAPKQELFVAPAWTPERAALAEELAGEIGDEDTSLVDRAEQRSDRFEGYSESRAADAESAHKAVSAICEGIPFGQPILVGHHSERHARKDAERIRNGMSKAVKMWKTSEYWTRRAAGAIHAAKYKERPDVRARRIKKLESELRKFQKNLKHAERALVLWADIHTGDIIKRKDGQPVTARDRALHISNQQGYLWQRFPLAEYPRSPDASQYEGEQSVWGALNDNIITPDQAAALSIAANERIAASNRQWIAHTENRLAYERAMLADSGGTAADRTGPEVGGAVQSLWAPARGGWAYIQKVNKVTVSLLFSHNPGSGKVWRHNEPLDKLRNIMSAAQVAEAREAGRIHEVTEGGKVVGFYLLDAPPETFTPKPDKSEQAAKFAAVAEAIKAGVQVVAAPQLFPTPPDIAAQMAELADIQPEQRILEPSAGTGNLIRAMLAAQPEGLDIVAVELNHDLAIKLSADGLAGFVEAGDFLKCNGDLGTFDRIVMNPPFQGGADIRHIQHAATMLRPGGRLVALCADGPRQRDTLKPYAEESGGTYEALPPGSFKDQGTGVNVALLVIEK